MAKSRFKGDWKKLERTLDPRKMNPVIKRHMEKASRIIGFIGVAKIKDHIKAGKYKPNKPLTVAIKNSSKPLIGVDDGAQLYNSITSVPKGSSVFVGVLKTDRFYNVALFLHQGGVIQVTEKMRLMFKVLWLASLGHISPSELTGRAIELWEEMDKDWKPLKQSTSAIVIPSRPYIKKAFTGKKFFVSIQRIWKEALEAAYFEMMTGK